MRQYGIKSDYFMPIFCLVHGLKNEQQKNLQTKFLKFETFVQLKNGGPNYVTNYQKQQNEPTKPDRRFLRKGLNAKFL
jgi:hypothetical protein